MDDEHVDYPAMALSSYMIGSGMNSRLFQRIRNREGLSYGVGAYFSAPTRDDDAAFRAYAICAPENAPRVESSFLSEIGDILENGFTAEEVAAAKTSWLQTRQVERAEDQRLVWQLSGHRFWDRTMERDAELDKKVMALQPDDLRTALRKHVDLSHLSIFRAGDFQKAGVNW
jgi:zinc protease